MNALSRLLARGNSFVWRGNAARPEIIAVTNIQHNVGFDKKGWVSRASEGIGVVKR